MQLDEIKHNWMNADIRCGRLTSVLKDVTEQLKKVLMLTPVPCQCNVDGVQTLPKCEKCIEVQKGWELQIEAEALVEEMRQAETEQ